MRWYQDMQSKALARSLLRRAGILRDQDRLEFDSAPWKWNAERFAAQQLESLMDDAHVDPADGWNMTLRDLMAAFCEAHDEYVAQTAIHAEEPSDDLEDRLAESVAIAMEANGAGTDASRALAQARKP